MKAQQHIYNKNIKMVSHNQLGFSLVELLVAMLIGLFLLTGIITTFISTKDSDLKRKAISEMDSNARFAMNVLRQTISHAGYPSTYSVDLDKPFFTTSDTPLSASQTPKCGGSASVTRDLALPRNWERTRDKSRTDILTTVSIADNPCKAGFSSCADPANANPEALVYYDCLGGGMERDAHAVSCSADPLVGMPDQRDAKIYSTFRVMNDRTLYCRGSRTSAPDSGAQARGEALIEDVEAMQFLYGVTRENADGTTSTVYKRAGDVSQWAFVTSVQVGLLLRSSDQYFLKTDATKISYNVLDRKINITAGQRRRLYRIYTTTIDLRNRRLGAFL